MDATAAKRASVDAPAPTAAPPAAPAALATSEFTPAFFDTASAAWRENKYALPRGAFQYVVRPVAVADEGFPGLWD